MDERGRVENVCDSGAGKLDQVDHRVFETSVMNGEVDGQVNTRIWKNNSVNITRTELMKVLV